MSSQDDSRKNISRWLNNRDFKSIIKTDNENSNPIQYRPRKFDCFSCKRGKKL